MASVHIVQAKRHTGDKDRPSICFYPRCLTACPHYLKSADTPGKEIVSIIPSETAFTAQSVVKEYACSVMVSILSTEQLQAKVWNLTRKVPGSSGKQHTCSPGMCSIVMYVARVLFGTTRPSRLHSCMDVIHLLLDLCRCSRAMLKPLLSYYNVSLGFCSVTKAPFTAAVGLLSLISLEFNCSGWKVPESFKAATMSVMAHPSLRFYKHL